jgi:hypothetical protein
MWVEQYKKILKQAEEYIFGKNLRCKWDHKMQGNFIQSSLGQKKSYGPENMVNYKISIFYFRYLKVINCHEYVGRTTHKTNKLKNTFMGRM